MLKFTPIGVFRHIINLMWLLLVYFIGTLLPLRLIYGFRTWPPLTSTQESNNYYFRLIANRYILVSSDSTVNFFFHRKRSYIYNIKRYYQEFYKKVPCLHLSKYSIFCIIPSITISIHILISPYNINITPQVSTHVYYVIILYIIHPR